MSDSELQARVAANPNIAGASTFPSRAVAESSIRDVLNANSSQIQNWLSGSGGKLTLNGHMAEPIGRYVAQGSGSVVDVSGVRVILVRDSNMQLGYRIQTAFPTP